MAFNFIPSDNTALVKDDFNEARYTGGRISVRYDIDDTWSLLVGASQQTLDTEGVFFVDPDLDDLEIQRYEDDSMEDSFENFNWTLEGRLGNLDVVYTGAFTDRDVDQFVDYTDYLFVGQYLPYYICDASVKLPPVTALLQELANRPICTLKAAVKPRWKPMNFASPLMKISVFVLPLVRITVL